MNVGDGDLPKGEKGNVKEKVKDCDWHFNNLTIFVNIPQNNITPMPIRPVGGVI